MICGRRSEFFAEVRDPAKAVFFPPARRADRMSRQLTQASFNMVVEGDGAWKFLGVSQARMIDQALSAVGDFGEVRLVVQKGRIRYVVIQKSHDALRWEAEAVRHVEP